MLAVFLVASASGYPIAYTLVGVQFNDGGAAFGSFIYDPATNVYSNVNITTTTGSVRSGATYTFVCGQDVPSCTGVAPNSTELLNLTTSDANQTGEPGLALFFTGVGSTMGLGTATQFDISNSSLSVGAGQEASCKDAACSQPADPSRVTVAGFVVAVISNQVKYVSNLNIGDGFVNITNTGASGGNLCANIYTFDPQEELISCCTCSVTPNGLQSLSVVKSLISNPLTPAVPSAVMVKIVATAGTCNASSISPNNLAPGLLAWGTSLHAAPTSPVSYSVTETPFAPAILSLPDFVHISSTCGFIQADGSGFGICGGCPANGLGAGTANQ
ncbi:MAG TPA: hypothetical protein VKG25_25555 [Bryobacteraceae bacterium]|nr:hypothetical protein [Bryobacteraceae bacterium]